MSLKQAPIELSIRKEKENRGVVVNSLSGLYPPQYHTPPTHNVKYNSISASASAWANTVKQMPIFWTA